MSNLIAAPASSPIKPPDRGLFWGVLVSLLLHALLLSLQFGIPGFRPGPGGPLTVRLVPLPAQPAPQTVPAPVAPVAPVPPVPSPVPDVAAAMPSVPPGEALPAQTLPVQHAQPGFTLIDPPRPQPAPPPPAIRPPRAPRRRVRPHARAKHDGLHTKVIAQDAHKDDSFAVPPAAGEPAPDADASARTADAPMPTEPAPAPAPEVAQAPQPDTPPAEAVQPAPAEPTEAEQQAERERLAEQRERALAARREADEQALQAAADAEARRAAEQQARLLTQQGTRYEDELAARQRQADEEAQRQAAAREQAAQAAQQLAEQQRIQAEQARAQQLAEQQRIQAEQARAQQLAEQQRIQAEQAKAQQLAEQQRVQAEQAKAQQLAEQQRIQAEQARARQQAEQLAREKAAQAEEAQRLARQEQARRQPDSGLDAGAPARAAAPGNSGLDGPGRGTGTLPRSALDSPLASRARELLRGIDIDKPVPQAVRPAEDARRNLRRALAGAAQHDVPLRLYVDSIRQKIERNAIVSPSQLAADAVRIFPIVSIAVRSDGSIEDVTIVRSSGRADVDEVVRRIVRLNARYAAFPPNVAANYDVVELRRVWSFAGALRLLEEMN